MIATKCPSVDQLRALSLGQLSDQYSDELFGHIRGCETCKIELEAVEDTEDSLIASLRAPDENAGFDAESDCHVAVAKALGALALAGDPAAGTDLDPLPKMIGEYEIVRPLGRGGMGSVFLARHTKLGREVAIKILAGHRLANSRMRERFEAEMRAVGKLNHPNVVAAHDAREVEGTEVLVTEYIDGLDLNQLIRRTGPLEAADACEIGRQVAAALQYTSEQGFVHRDVKPSNVMLSRSGEVKLLDLGLARLQLDDHEHVGVTGTGQTMGTADYVAPEQVTDSRGVDARADIYSLGCTLFKLLTGAAPFADAEHATVFAKMTAHVSHQPPSLAEFLPDAPADLIELVDSMLAKDAANRPQSPQAVAERLARFTDSSDLERLVTQAETLEPIDSRSLGAATPSPKTSSRTLPLLRRSVPMPIAIGGGIAGLLIGLCMGIVITIEYPDGTVLTAPLPPGSKVTVEESSSGSGTGVEGANASPILPTVAPDSSSGLGAVTEGFHTIEEVPLRNAMESSSGLGAGAEGAVSGDETATDFSPLKFAVLVEQAAWLDAESLKSAKQELAQSDADGPVITDVGTWYPVASHVSVPVEATHRDQRYALARDDRQGLIRWEEIGGHLNATSSSRTDPQEAAIEFGFDDDLAERMRELTRNNLRRKLAIVLDGRVISAPKITAELGGQARITGKFSEQEIRFLMGALNGLLVEPSQPGPSEDTSGQEAGVDANASAAITQPRPDVDSDPAEIFQGVWGIVSVNSINVGGEEIGHTDFVMGFDGTHYYSATARSLTGGGTFSLDRDGRQRTIVLRDELARQEPLPVMQGIYRVRSDGQLETHLNQAPRGDRPSSFDTKEAPGTTVVYTFERLGDMPQTSEEARAMAEAAEGELSKAIMTLFSASQVPPTALELPTSEERTAVSKQAKTRDNLKQIGVAFHNFHAAYHKFPGSSNELEGSTGPRGEPFSWRVAILPFIEHQDLFEQYRFDEPWDSEHNSTLLSKMPDVYRSPHWEQAGPVHPVGETHYQGFTGEHTALGSEDGVRLREITDGTSPTLLIAETRSTVPWTKPQDIPFEKPEDAGNVTPFENQPLYYLTADGAVHSMDPVDREKLSKLITRDGRERVEP